MNDKLSATLYLLITICLLTACGNAGPAYRIGFSQCSQGPWREKVNQEMLAAQHLYEHDVTVSIAQSYDDGELQARQIDSLTASGIDLLVVAPNEDSEALNAAIGRTLGKGVPVVFFDRKTSVEGYTAFIGGNNVEAGRVVGTAVATTVKSGGGSRILEITGAMSSSPAQERHQGFAEAIKQCDGTEYERHDGEWTSDEACRIVKAKMAGGWMPDIVFCHNDGMATGVYKALVETGHEGDMMVYGIDGMAGEGLEYVRLGHQVGTYVYPTHGEKIIRLALDILTGKDYERENSLQGMMVTPENVEIVTLNANELMAQNDNLVTIQNKLELLGKDDILCARRLQVAVGLAEDVAQLSAHGVGIKQRLLFVHGLPLADGTPPGDVANTQHQAPDTQHQAPAPQHPQGAPLRVVESEIGFKLVLNGH